MDRDACSSRGRVVLVGAGPGDPELLTIKAVKALQRATVALVDDLVDAGVLDYLAPSVRVIHVGKRGGCASTPQAFIHRLMIAEALRGESVVRIKGGDPFVFGRGSEELDALNDAGIEVEVIPGITAGIAAPASVGVPVTDRRCAPGVAFVTGHVREGGTEPDWAALARSGLTLVIYMGVARCAEITQALISAGLPASTPAAVVSRGCTPDARHHLTSLSHLAQEISQLGFASPAIIVIGEVARSARATQSITLSAAATGTHHRPDTSRIQARAEYPSRSESAPRRRKTMQ